jgi:hypothetical protein
MKKLAIFVGTAFVVLSFLGINCYAGGNAIYGCYQKNGGELRIVSNINSCRHNETPVSWNKIGPQGPTGATGPMGPAGPPGTQAQVVPQAQDPRVYDAQGNLLGIFPSTWEGLLSFFVPTLSRFLLISPGSGDVDPSYPAVSFYYENTDCTGKPFLEVNVRYQILKVGSKYLTADDGPAVCTNSPNSANSPTIKSVAAPYWNELGKLDYSGCAPVDSTLCTLVVPSKEVQLPFSMPVNLPVHFQ